MERILEPEPSLPIVEVLSRLRGLGYAGGKSGANCFTKVKVRVDADQALKSYFKSHEAEVESWFNVIAPRGGTLKQLREDMVKLADKDWKRIRAT